MLSDQVPSQTTVSAYESELARTGVVVLTPSTGRVVSSQLPAIGALCVGAWLVPQAIELGGAGRWITTALLLAAGLHGAWQLCLALWGPGRHPVRVSADGLHDEATDGRLAWSDIIGVELDQRTVRGFAISRWVVLRVHPAAARAWSGPGSAVAGFVDELREDMDTRLGGTSRVQLPAGLLDPVSLRQWLEEELSRRGRP